MWAGRGTAALLILLAAVLPAGCTRTVTGQARGGEPAPGVDSLFHGELLDYGQKLTEDEKTTLKYARALRGVDPCGFVANLKEFGDPAQFVGDFQACTASVKIAGAPGLTAVDYQYFLQDTAGSGEAFRVGDVPVYDLKDACEYQVPLMLERLPGAPKSAALQPVLSVSLYDVMSEDTPDPDCRLSREVVTAIAKQLPSGLQPRSALSAYPIKLAERDPCEILREYPGQARKVSVDLLGDPFGCDFTLQGSDIDYSLNLLSSGGDLPAEYYEQSERDGVKYFQNDDPNSDVGCHAVALVGDPLYPKDIGGGATQADSDPYYPAITVGAFSGEVSADCGQMRQILDKAVRLFANSAR
ncbi:hypothetical protein FZI91_21830 [Mycobacterium sp. CBMA271]|uniref:hypothetical protein n=1 Tax=unclassified Mycobacteroides TaxID=2618759 RepID=UPI0012DDF750|nr:MULTISPECIES: hypothetical protein [unclassified Mycobacteroides]MUM19720.1 hypothetical protein [Mycobacteroides sp. CBMA 326]MUM24324.1 hypothetical protein [Mycobacteroides sp. CBMA 271]